MTFNPSHKNKHDKPYGESGYYRSTVENISIYFDKFKALNNEQLLEENDFELWKFTTYYDFMSHIAQHLENLRSHGQSLKSARSVLCEVVNMCQKFQKDGSMVIKEVMLAIIAESYPSTHFLKDYRSDYQVRTDLTWEDFMKGDNVPNIEQLRQILVNNIEPNEIETDPQFLR